MSRRTCFSVLMYVIHQKYELTVTSLIVGDPPVAAAAARSPILKFCWEACQIAPLLKLLGAWGRRVNVNAIAHRDLGCGSGAALEAVLVCWR